ncbi:hypothetical protein TELCIR_14007, partial [Teladorsagia circumcincta]
MYAGKDILIETKISRELASSFSNHHELANGSNNGIDPFLRQIDVRFNTSSGNEILVEAVYQDTTPSGSRLGTVVAIHGAPGSHKDFKYVTPLLQEKGIRFIGVNMPGFGLTPGDPRLRCDNTERNNFVNELIARIGNVEPLVVMGHSRGCENATAVAAMNVDKLTGLVLVNPTGLRLHRGLRPFWTRVLVAYSGKDFLIETSLSRELANSFEDHKEL